jgi:hypothetical protein
MVDGAYLFLIFLTEIIKITFIHTCTHAHTETSIAYIRDIIERYSLIWLFDKILEENTTEWSILKNFLTVKCVIYYH